CLQFIEKSNMYLTSDNDSVFAVIESANCFEENREEYRKIITQILEDTLEFVNQAKEEHNTPHSIEIALLERTLEEVPHPESKQEWIPLQISEYIDHWWFSEQPGYEFTDSIVFADSDCAIQIITSMKTHNPSIIQEVLQVLSRKGRIKKVPNRKAASEIVKIGGWSALGKHLIGLPNHLVASTLDMEELRGLVIPIDFFIKSLPDTVSFEDGRTEAYSGVIAALEKQILLGGSTFDLDVVAMKDTEAARFITTIVESRKQEIESVSLKINEKGFVNIESLNETYYGRKLVKACDSKTEVEYHVIDTFNEELAKFDIKLNVSNLHGSKIIKLLIWGPYACGKSSIVKRFVFDKYEIVTEDEPIDVYMKDTRIDSKDYKLFLWDTLLFDNYGLGYDSFRFSTERPLKDILNKVQGIVLVYTITNPKSFELLKKMFEELCKNCHDLPAIAIVGNKVDRRENPHSTIYSKGGEQMAKDLSNRYGIPTLYKKVSAKSGENIESLFEELVRMIKQ
ncbi:MAG: hypothetical protein KAU48_13730, partial [Candidatus Thorarchaeota archaeon]|nr:hypothetical protein [Candidatus Thorarchaeota archaeon]